MKLKVVALSLMLLGSTAAYADGTPDILRSINAESKTVLNKDEASKLRGEYRVCGTTQWNRSCSIKSFSQPVRTGIMYGQN